MRLRVEAGGLCRLLTGLGREDAGKLRGWMRLYRWAKMLDGVDLEYDNGLFSFD